jgi:hypothetical protein
VCRAVEFNQRRFLLEPLALLPRQSVMASHLLHRLRHGLSEQSVFLIFTLDQGRWLRSVPLGSGHHAWIRLRVSVSLL